MTDFKVFINFKTYSQGTGEKAVELAKTIREVSEVSRVPQVSRVSGEFEIQIIPIVQSADIFRIKKEVDIPVWVQHLDWQEQGAFTGWQNLEAVIKAGASGVLLNHSEHQIPPGTIKQILSRIENCKTCPEPVEGLKIENFSSMVCCKTLGQMERLVKFNPDYIGYEISELIGGRISITEANPKSIGRAKEVCGKISLIVGAGIHRSEDLEKAYKLGAKGVLISSAVVLAENPTEKLLELLSLLRKGIKK